jgi:hypothetical protein
MTANNQYYMGENHVPAYQMSASPFVTSSNVSLGQVKEIGFGGYVSRFIIVKNTGATSTVLSVGFTENGLKPANSNFFVLSGSESFAAEMRVDRVFVSGSSGAPTFSVVAGLTGVTSSRFLLVTASNGFSGVG